MDFSPIANHVQEWPCDALIGICDADHCGSQHIRYYPKSSNWSRLPEGKKTEESSIQKTILSSWKLCKFFGKGSVHSNQLNQTWVTKLRTTPQESCKTKKMESDIQMYQANPSILREGALMQLACESEAEICQDSETFFPLLPQSHRFITTHTTGYLSSTMTSGALLTRWLIWLVFGPQVMIISCILITFNTEHSTEVIKPY